MLPFLFFEISRRSTALLYFVPPLRLRLRGTFHLSPLRVGPPRGGVLPFFMTICVIVLAGLNYHRIHEPECFGWRRHPFLFPPPPSPALEPLPSRPWSHPLFHTPPAAPPGTSIWSGNALRASTATGFYSDEGRARWVHPAPGYSSSSGSSAPTILRQHSSSFKRPRHQGPRLLHSFAFFPLLLRRLEMTRSIGEFSFPWSHPGYVFGNHLNFCRRLAHRRLQLLAITVTAQHERSHRVHPPAQNSHVARSPPSSSLPFVYGHIIREARSTAVPRHRSQDAPTLSPLVRRIHTRRTVEPEDMIPSSRRPGSSSYGTT